MKRSRSAPDESTDAGDTIDVALTGSADLVAALTALRAAGPRHLIEKQVVASGGMGVVRAVEDPLLQRLQAKKSLHPFNAEDPSQQAALLREARVMGALEHPGVVPVHEVALDDDGHLCFTMKLVRGDTLAQRLQELPAHAPLDRDRLLDLVDVVVKVCDALSYAHARGVIHCDVKASNVLVGAHGQVYLMDWGVARLVAEAPGAQPVPARVASSEAGETAPLCGGSPVHMSPEQVLGQTRRIGPRTDVYLVGALIYEILTRRPVHEARSHAATLDHAARDAVVPPSSVVPRRRVPAELERIAMRALAFEPEDRYPDVAALRDDLVRFVRGGAEFPRVEFAPGEVITRQGDPGDTAYLIISGHCEVSMLTDGKRKVVRTMGPGDAFGETALLSPGPRTATVTALEPLTLAVVGRDRFDNALDTMPDWMRRFVLALAGRFRERETANRG